MFIVVSIVSTAETDKIRNELEAVGYQCVKAINVSIRYLESFPDHYSLDNFFNVS